MEYELKHKWELNRNQWFMKLFIKAWTFDREPRNITFCKLFWGYVFLPLAMLIKFLLLVFLCVAYPFFALSDSYRRKHAKSISLAPMPTSDDSVGDKKLEGIATFFARISLAIGNFWFKHRSLLLPLFAGIGILLLLAVGALLGYLVLTLSIDWLVALLSLGIVMGVFLLIVLTIFVIVTLLDRSDRRKELGKHTTGQVIKQAYIAVKTNTCPQIVLKD